MTHIARWFPGAKLGIFVHFGVFRSMLRGDEDRKTDRRSLTADEFDRRAALVTCEKLDMGEWVGKFKHWGARYAVLTTRHSAGFSLWDTAVDDWSIVKKSPFGQDLVRLWADELRKAGLKVGFYFCHRDWHDPDFRADMENESYAEPDPRKRAEAWERYIEKRNAKVRELLTNYGKVDLFWADEDWGRTHEQLRSDELASQIEQLQPGIVMNNRFAHPYVGHYGSPEQQAPINPITVPFEVCDTLHDSKHWQWVEWEYDYKPWTDVLRTFIDVISLGGNYLINIGPRPDGSLVEKESAILDKIGEFCRVNAEAVYGTSAGVPRSCFGGGSTIKGNHLYLFAVDKARDEYCFRGIKNPIVKITRVSTGEELSFRKSGGRGAGYYWFKDAQDGGEMPVVYKVTFEGKRIEYQRK